MSHTIDREMTIISLSELWSHFDGFRKMYVEEIRRTPRTKANAERLAQLRERLAKAILWQNALQVASCEVQKHMKEYEEYRFDD